MNFKTHFFFECITLIPIGLLLYYYIMKSLVVIPMVSLAIWLGSIVPDADQRFDSALHRHWLFHSVIVITVFWVLSWSIPMLAFLMAWIGLGIGLHLLLDCHFHSHKMMGTYTVKFFKYYKLLTTQWKVVGLSGKWSTAWYFCNFLVSLIIFLITIVNVI